MNDGFHDDLARVMRDHEDEAPTRADLLVALRSNSRLAWSAPGRASRRKYIPLAAAAAVAAVIAGSVWVGAQLAGNWRVPVGHVPRLSCPAKYAGAAPWVPAKPVDVNARIRLVPRQVPRSAVVCAYDGRNIGPQSGWALSGRKLLNRGLAALTAQLTWQPVLAPGQPIPCTSMAGKQVNYLIGLAYKDGGRLWVAATQDPNFCVKSSNGEFTTFGVIGPLVTRAFATGKWPGRHPASCHGLVQDIGRLGQDKAMVPPGVTSLTICGHRDRTIYSGYQRLVAALNALPRQPSTRGCTQAPGKSGPSYRLRFSYAQGPLVQVNVDPKCSPQIDNLSLQSGSARSIVPIIERLLR